ncbi:isopenicillin N synthase family oxygenase [Cryobacterium sp. TMT1-2-2]|nr:isopenicillin N synthase family oxygenase [Cryobacterium sp. TMT1-2-2]
MGTGYRWLPTLNHQPRKRFVFRSEVVVESGGQSGDATKPFTVMKIVRYPGKFDPTPKQGVGAHKDSGVLTLLLVEPGKGCLQVEKDGARIDAPPLDGAFVANIGELLEVATDVYLNATVHRVISPLLTLPDELETPGIMAEPENPIFTTYGENALKSRLRTHPDVAAIHYSDLAK